MNRNIYPIINVTQNCSLNIDFVKTVLTSLKPRYLQIRMKESSHIELVCATLQIIEIKKRLNLETSIIVNDSVDAAVESGADGVHVGQKDCCAEIIKERFPKLIVGLSTHNIDQVAYANSLDIDYIGFGPVFETSTKKDHDPVVGNLTEKAIAISKHSVVFIGGINKKNIALLPSSDKVFFALVSALGDFIKV